MQLLKKKNEKELGKQSSKRKSTGKKIKKPSIHPYLTKRLLFKKWIEKKKVFSSCQSDLTFLPAITSRWLYCRWRDMNSSSWSHVVIALRVGISKVHFVFSRYDECTPFWLQLFPVLLTLIYKSLFLFIYLFFFVMSY